MGKQQVDYAEAEKMLRSGATQREVADRFGVSQPAINQAIARGRIKGIAYERTASELSAVPWHPIKPEHRSRYLVRMLRAAVRRNRGERSAPVIEAQLDSFLAKARDADWVIHYDPETQDGFVRVPRRDGIDTGLIRNPYVDDAGHPIQSPKGVYPRSARAAQVGAAEEFLGPRGVEGGRLVLAVLDDEGNVLRFWPIGEQGRSVLER